MNVRLTPAAKADMGRVWSYCENHRPGLGDEFLSDLGGAVRLVGEYPMAPSVFWKDTRRVPLKRFPYGFAYRVEEHEVLVIVIAHTSRASRIWRKRLQGNS